MPKPTFHGGQLIICKDCKSPEPLRIKFLDLDAERYYLFPDKDGDEGTIPFSSQDKFKSIMT